MKVSFKKKDYEIKELNHKQRLSLIGMSAGVLGKGGQILNGKGFGEFLVEVFELSGLKDSDFKGLDEAEHVEFITAIRNAWFPNEKK